MSRDFRLFLVFLAGSLPFFPLLIGQYINDDITHIGWNGELQGIRTLKQALLFYIQPSRPVSNLLLGLTQYFTNGELWVHRLVTMVIHLLVLALIFENTRFLLVRLGKVALSEKLPTWLGLIFAVHTLQVDFMAVSVYRWELLAALFTLFASLLAQRAAASGKIARWPVILGISVSMASAILSKETYGLFCPIVVALFYFTPSPALFDRRLIATTVFSSLISGSFLFYLLTLPTRFPLPVPLLNEVNVLGPLPYHFTSSGFAMMEELRILISPVNLSLAPFGDRYLFNDPGKILVYALLSLLIWLTAFILAYQLWRKGGFLRVWGGIFWLVTIVYNGLPSPNLGSQHYFYLATAAFFAVFLYFILDDEGSRVRLRVLKRTGVAAFIGLLILNTDRRVQQLRSPYTLHLSELETNAKWNWAWLFLTDYITQTQGGRGAARELVIRARQLFPRDPFFLYQDFAYYYAMKPKVEMHRRFKSLEENYSEPTLRLFLFNAIAQLASQKHDCDLAEEAYRECLKILPDHKKLLSAYKVFRHDSQTIPNFCSPSPS